MITYLDNARTTYPKPEGVYAAVDRVTRAHGVLPGAGSHRLARAAASLQQETRELAARVAGGPSGGRVVLTHGAGHALALALDLLVTPEGEVVTTTLEHEALSRPLERIARSRAVTVRAAAPGADGVVTPESVEALITPRTSLVAVVHACAVTGVVLPVAEIARTARARGVRVLVDSAQTAGLVPLEAGAWGIDALALCGHKALFGHPGAGALWLADGVASEIEALDGDEGPGLAALASLHAGISSVLDAGLDRARGHVAELVGMFTRHADAIDGLTLHVPPALERIALVTFSLAGFGPAQLQEALDEGFDIAVGEGLFGAPGAHRTLGTHPAGAVRMSVSRMTTDRDVGHLVEALHSLSLTA